MARLIGRLSVGLLTRPQMARGCELCFPGDKSVVFVTGLCGDSCYYCPVGKHRLYHDVFYVNERRVNSVEEALNEVARSGSRGASITGGDPLARPERTLEVISALKSSFGAGFHIHLYTSGRYANVSLLRALERAGLDEIRFHPTIPGLEKKVELALRVTSMKVGIEVPGIPGREEWLLNLARYLDRVGGHFMNVNELEVSEANLGSLRARGMKVDASGVVVETSRETILKFMERALEEGIRVPIHYCPASFKDSVQTRFRMRRTGHVSGRIYERVTTEGVVEWLELRVIAEGSCRNRLRRAIQEGVVFEDEGALRTRPEALPYIESFFENCLEKAELVRAHPTLPRLVLERAPALSGIRRTTGGN